MFSFCSSLSEKLANFDKKFLHKVHKSALYSSRWTILLQRLFLKSFLKLSVFSDPKGTLSGKLISAGLSISQYCFLRVQMKFLKEFLSIFLILGYWAKIFGLLVIFLAGLSSLSNLYSTWPAEDSEGKYCFQFFPHRSSDFVQKSAHFSTFFLARSSKLQSFCPDETIQKTFLRKKKQNT